jgi:hypothetical protein
MLSVSPSKETFSPSSVEVWAKKRLLFSAISLPRLAMHHALSAQVTLVTRDYSAAIQYARQATVIIADF